jgi:NAD(P)-dependent dehydrogenase (short-subunit alcohol dehydrogenase family)
MKVDISGKIALVTGANRGIGRSIVDVFMRHGTTKIYAGVRTLPKAEPLVQDYGDVIVPIQIDLEKPETIIHAAETATDVQILVNNAGVLRTASPLAENAIECLEHEMNINTVGLIRMTQAFAPLLKKNGGGAIIQLNSIASLKTFPDFATYCASKAASYAITQALRQLLQTQGTAVLSVHPGPIATDMAHSAGFDEVAEPASKVAEGIVKSLKAGHFHLFPDSMAQEVGSAYQSFAENIVEANLFEE